jgi:hypothetical protein
MRISCYYYHYLNGLKIMFTLFEISKHIEDSARLLHCPTAGQNK